MVPNAEDGPHLQHIKSNLLLQSGFPREIDPIGYIFREIYFKELAHAIVGAIKSKICRAGQPFGNSGRISIMQSPSRILSCLGNLFVLKDKSFQLIGKAHPQCEGNLLYLKSTEYKC